MLGTGRGRVNEGQTDMAMKVQSQQFQASQALAYPVVRKGSHFESPFGGLSPPVSAGWSLVHRYTQ